MGEIEDIIRKRFDEFGFPLIVDRSIIPNDDSTLFICSGMQQVKDRFRKSDGSVYGSRQSCIRTNDLDLVGDGSHLTYFEMIGNFSFWGPSYEVSIELWNVILQDLGLNDLEIHIHPDRFDLNEIWTRLGYKTTYDVTCIWSDGDISGECCEVFCGDIEIGNLVNPMGHSTDVGFGWERLHQVYEHKTRIDDTSLFIDHHPIVKDHYRAVCAFHEADIIPSNKKHGYVCRRMITRMLPFLRGDEGFIFHEWIRQEKDRHEKKLRLGRQKWQKYQDKSPEWWWDTFGILPEELRMIELELGSEKF